MKKIFFLMVIAATLLFTMSCNKAVNTDQILKDEISRQQVFEKIAADHELMTDFMEVMMKDNHAMMMMKGNQSMKDMMMVDGEMMKDKSGMMHNMMSEMMKDEKMMGHMMQMMNKEGMMSEECMQSCMKMMSDKGMDIDNMKEKENDDNHESHNH